jgi:hypothetical protein
MHIQKVFIELKRRKHVEYLLQFLSNLKQKKQDCLQFSIRYQETKLFGGYQDKKKLYRCLKESPKNLVS